MSGLWWYVYKQMDHVMAFDGTQYLGRSCGADHVPYVRLIIWAGGESSLFRMGSY